MYRDVDITPSSVDNNDAQDKYDELDGLVKHKTQKIFSLNFIAI